MSDKQESWIAKDFAQIAIIGNGQVSPLETPYIDYYHIGPENVESGTGRLSGIKTARELNLISGKYVFDSRAIIYSKIRPNLNKVCLPDFEGICSADMYPIWPKESVSREYLFYYMLSEGFVRQATRVSMRTGMPKINRQDLSKIKVEYPPLPEQRKIAAILSTWDKAITLTERRIEVARQRKMGLMQRLLTGRVRFPEFAGREWQEVQLGNLAEVKRGASPRPIRDPKWFAKSGRGWIRIADVTDSPTRFLNKTSQYLSPLGESKSVKVEIGELIMSICATIGVPKIVNIPACIHDGFVVFRGYGKHLHREFLYHYLNFITERLANRGQPGTQKNLNSTLVRKIRVPKPPLAEQERIAAVLQSCDREIELLTHKRDALQRQKKGLMQRLLTGRVRMKV